MASPNRRNTNSSSSSSSPQPGQPGGPRFFLQPRIVDHYLHNFKVALEDFFNTQDPGRTEDYHLIGDYVVPRNKRNIVIYVAHAPLATARKMSRIYFVLPVSPIHANMFDDDAEPGATLPSAGPLLHTFDIPDDHTAPEFINAIIAEVATGPEEGRLASWTSEISRVRTLAETAGVPFPMRRGASKIAQFWSPLRASILDILHKVGIKVPSAAGELPAPWRPAAAALSAAPSPAAPVATSSSERRRRHSSQRRRNAAAAARRTVRRITGDPSNGLGYVRDPVTGKLTRRRRPNSDPKD